MMDDSGSGQLRAATIQQPANDHTAVGLPPEMWPKACPELCWGYTLSYQHALDTMINRLVSCSVGFSKC